MKLKLLFFGSLISSAFIFYSCKNYDPITVQYTESEPYTDYEEMEVKLTYNMTDSYLKWRRTPGAVFTGRTPALTVSCNIENTSDYDGEFNLFAKVNSSAGEETVVSGSIYIKAHSFGTLSANTSIGHYTFEDANISDYTITPQTKTIRNEITRYRDVVKTRPCNPCEEDCGG